MKILVVEDHHDLRELFVEHLRDDGFEAFGVSCAEELDECMVDKTVDLIILDLKLTGEQGMDIAHRVRMANEGVHIIILTAQISEALRICAYESGADFYITKPISPLELSAVVKAVQRRRVACALPVCRLNVLCMSIVAPEGEISINKLDVALLKALAVAPERRLPYWRVFEITERDQSDTAKAQLELQVFRLREKFAKIGLPKTLIKCIRLDGVQLTSPIKINE